MRITFGFGSDEGVTFARANYNVRSWYECFLSEIRSSLWLYGSLVASIEELFTRQTTDVKLI